MPKVFYFISDLHIGGDEALGSCDYEDELIDFLRMLAERGEDAELIINGDAFGLWEFTDVEGPDKLAKLIGQFPAIFEQLRKTGEAVRITLLPGNHDYEIACYPEYVETLEPYNIGLAPTEAITRDLDGRKIWIEHGNQHDAFNRMPDFGNPYAQPIGYFLTSHMVSMAGRHSRRGRQNWLKDIQSVYPTEQIPYWVLSNYFYREMSPLLRWLLLPFLLLFGLTVFVVAGAALEYFGVTETNIFLDNRLFAELGYLGNLLQLVLIANAAILGLMLALAVPLWFIFRDVRQTMQRFELWPDAGDLVVQKEADYLAAAEAVFERDPKVAVFVYGHTHTASVRATGGRAVVNTGTWLKKLELVPVRFGYLPGIFVPSYCLSFFRIAAGTEGDGKAIVIEYGEVEKSAPKELNLLQRLLASRRRKPTEEIPARIVLTT